MLASEGDISAVIDAAGAHRGTEAEPERGARAPASCRRALRRGGTEPPPRPGPAAPSGSQPHRPVRAPQPHPSRTVPGPGLSRSWHPQLPWGENPFSSRC